MFVKRWLMNEAEAVAARIKESAHELGRTDAHAAWLALRPYYAMVQSSLIPLRHSHSLADPLATADSRAEKPKPIMGLFAPSLSYRSRSRAACIA